MSGSERVSLAKALGSMTRGGGGLMMVPKFWVVAARGDPEHAALPAPNPMRRHPPSPTTRRTSVVGKTESRALWGGA